MKHRVSGKKLGRTRSMRQALIKSLSAAFVINRRIETSRAKAKVVQPVIEKLVGLAKQNSLSSRRRLQSFLLEPSLVNKLLNQIKGSSRTSGFTRLIHTSIRRGDGARLARLEWVDSVPLAPSVPSLPSSPSRKTPQSPLKSSKVSADKAHSTHKPK